MANDEVLAGLLSSQPSPENLIMIIDDVGRWIELSLFLCELDTISETIFEYWRQAAKGELPIPLAAWLSTVAFHATRRNFLAMNHVSSSFEWVMSAVMETKNKAIKYHFKGIPQLASPFGGRIAGGAPFIHLGLMLHSCRSKNNHETILPEAGLRARLHGSDTEKIRRAILQDAELRQEPTDLIRPQMDIKPDLELLDDDDLALDLMLQSMRQLLASEGVMAALERSQDDEHICEPLLAPLRTFLGDDSEDACIPFHLVYGLELLLTTYKVFLWQGGDVKKPSCRNLALELAREVQKSVLEAESALESSGNQEHTARESSTRLKVQTAKLDEFSREQRSDLYYQSPWTAGCHMVEILDMAFHEGVNLCCGLRYVCAVLHLYNAMRHLDPPMHRITLLDQLSQLFIHELFLSTIPEENFRAHFRRALERGLAKETTSQTGRRRGLSVATTISKPEADRMSLSLFHELTSYDYQPTNEFLARIYIEPTLRDPTRSQLADVSREVHSVPFSVPLDKIKKAVSEEFTGDLPIMRTNLFAIFRFCTEVLRSVSEVGRDDTSSPKPPSASSGLEIVDEVLDIIDNHLGNDAKRNSLKSYRLLNNVWDVFAKIEANLSLSNYQWPI